VFLVETPHNYAETMNFINSNMKNMPTFSNTFKNGDKSYTTNYLSYDSISFVEEYAKINKFII